MDALSRGAAMVRRRARLAWMGGGAAAPSSRGAAFWLVTILDTDVQIEGPAVAECQRLFLDTWKGQKGPDLPEERYFPESQEPGRDLVRVVGSTPGRTNRITFVVYVSAITYASHSIH